MAIQSSVKGSYSIFHNIVFILTSDELESVPIEDNLIILEVGISLYAHVLLHK